MTATIPGERETQLAFEATTPAEFRQLLGRIRETSGLSCGQIAVKTKMPRSTAYSLPNPSRPGLPSNRDQVSDFVRACGLSETHIDVVMDLWTELHNELENAKDRPPVGAPGAVETHNYFSQVGQVGNAGHWSFRSRPSEDWGRETNIHVVMADPDMPQRKTTVTDLLHYVLRDEDRTRRALRLLLPIVAVILGLVVGLVFIAVTVPGTASGVVSGMVVALVLPIAWAARRRSTRPPQKKK